MKVNTLSADEILHEVDTLYSRWPRLELGEKRKIAESLVKKVTIGEDEIDLR